MRLGRKLSEGFAVDLEADDAAAGQPAPVADRAVPVTVESDHYAGAWSQPVGSVVTGTPVD